MAIYPCIRCAGNGTISAYSNVMGGVCFKCGGKGTQQNKPAAPGLWFAVLGTNPQGERVHCYNVKAKTAAQAIAKAQNLWANASTAWKNENSLADAIAVGRDEYWAARHAEAI